MGGTKGGSQNPSKGEWGMSQSKINPKCTLCMECASICPTDSIFLGVGQYVIDLDSCEGCGYCIPICPENAIRSIGSDKVSE